MRKAFAELTANSAILDGELCLIDPHWVKTKCPEWKRINAKRGKLFEDQR